MASFGANEVNCPFPENPPVTDVALIVEGKKLFVNKAILAVASPVFQTMFFSDSNFKEKDAKEVPLPGKKYDDVVAFLKRIYPNSVTSLTVNIVIQLLPLFHEYGCKRQIEECEELIKTSLNGDKGYIGMENLVVILNLLKIHGQQDLYEICLQEASSRRMYDIRRCINQKQIPDRVIEDLFSRTIQTSYFKTKGWARSIRSEIKYCMDQRCKECKDKACFQELREKAEKFFQEYKD